MSNENNVILYTQQSCGMCRAIHMLMDKKHIEYKEVIINSENIDAYKELGITTTPTLEVDGQRLIGKELKDWVNAR